MIQLIIIAIYLCLLLFLGVFSSKLFRGTSKDYMLASHSIGPFMLLMSLFGTTMTAFALVGSTGEAYKIGAGVYGLLASSSGIIHSLCFFVLGIKLWDLGRKYGYTTQIQYFRDRLQSDKIGIILFPILVGLVIPYLLIGVMASGTVINSITEGAFATAFAQHDYGIPPWLGSLVISIVVLIYVFFGGMRGTAMANTAQTIVFMILGLITFVVISSKLGGMAAATKLVVEKNPSKMMRAVHPDDDKAFERKYAQWERLAEFKFAQKKGLKLTPEQIKTAMEAYKGPDLPHKPLLAQANFSAAQGLIKLSVKEQNLSRLQQDDRLFDEATLPATLITHESLVAYKRQPGADAKGAAANKMIQSKVGHPDKFIDDDESKGKCWTRKKAKGVYRATSWSPDKPHPMNPWKFLTYFFVPLSVGMFPHLFQHWLTAKSADSFKLAVVAHPVFIMIVWVPCVLLGVWMTSAINPATGGSLIAPHFPPNAVLPAAVKALTPDAMAGLLTAGILAAIMSSLDSQFLCVGTMFTTDIVTHYSKPGKYSDKQLILIARMFIIGIVAVTYLFSLFEPRRVFTLGVWCFSGFSSLFPLIFASLYWRRLTKAGAYAAVIAAAASWLYLFRDSGYAANAEYDFLGVMPVATMTFLSTTFMILVSLATKPPSEETLKRFFPDKSGA
jgi:SSS family solute:Na+ symporter